MMHPHATVTAFPEFSRFFIVRVSFAEYDPQARGVHQHLDAVKTRRCGDVCRMNARRVGTAYQRVLFGVDRFALLEAGSRW
jgi:hypothetical protein